MTDPTGLYSDDGEYAEDEAWFYGFDNTSYSDGGGSGSQETPGAASGPVNLPGWKDMTLTIPNQGGGTPAGPDTNVRIYNNSSELEQATIDAGALASPGLVLTGANGETITIGADGSVTSPSPFGPASPNAGSGGNLTFTGWPCGGGGLSAQQVEELKRERERLREGVSDNLMPPHTGLVDAGLLATGAIVGTLGTVAGVLPTAGLGITKIFNPGTDMWAYYEGEWDALETMWRASTPGKLVRIHEINKTLKGQE
jgi:hypothetical protein